ncbi:DUF4365 domain-containing protein [Streptomyces sp. Je 1-79]|uniref:DUF4365 domain-containing protein n=1 Tax=Streptomyces sp. Je 1-79 TaxID=2943847 RepID=UPI0021A35A10|nr:DUF4365 domain-containing protein [Streptomyces sp. Je 1-79]MCT4355870.1 DUF4365 domain-containing protein [Streptomyces sp. Je 1-79]
MQVRPTQKVERLGVSWIEHIVNGELGWLFREQATADFGIDAQIEIVDAETFEATGRLIGVQIKSGLSYFGKPAEDGWWFGCSTDHTSYWLGHSLPVVVMLYHPEEKTAYWQHVNRQTVHSTGKGAKIHIPRSHRLASTSTEALRPLALSVSEAPAIEDWTASPPEGLAQRDAYFRHLVSARLCAKIPGAHVEAEQFDRLWDMNLWVHDNSMDPGSELGVHLALPQSPAAVENIQSQYRGSIFPLVIFYTGTQDLDSRDRNANTDNRVAPIFLVEWRGSAAGKSLDVAVAEALDWAGRFEAFGKPEK